MSKRGFAGAARVLLTLSLLGCGTEPSSEDAVALGEVSSALTQVTGFGSNPGNLRMWKHVPAGVPANAPLVVALHGCTQTANAYTNAGWNALAEQLKFYVLYPEQPSANNQNSCFNWFEPGDIARGSGEALSIKQMVDKMKADHSIDPGRVFVTGLSAGGAMAHVMAATYPDVFSGAAIMAGIPYKCATSMVDAFSCMSPGVNKTADQWASLVRGAYPGYTGAYPKISLWHGTSDYTVKNTNQVEALEQWTAAHGIDMTADVSDSVATYPHKVYKNNAGQALVETYELTGMGHGTAIDPATKFPGTSVACGTAGAYILDTNICSTLEVARFFGLDNSNTPGTPDDTVAPTVSLSAPANGATVSGTVTLSANASDNVGVTQVAFLVDGAVVGTDSTPPFTFAWNTATAATGPHSLAARASDAAGNTTTSSPITVTVSVDQNPARFTETFSTNGPDNVGWTLTEWALDSGDQTGSSGSRSILGSATPSFNTVTRTASVSVALPSNPRLTYWRKLDLSGANTLASVSFKVVVNAGNDVVVDSVTKGLGTVTESTWTQRANIDLSAYANRTVTLKFIVSATDTASTVSRARAWVDGITVGTP
ncbi:extracellular catalytic domain type 1 short-chain-length polyhydroxyalkanoate depolymerase [Cystobacter ferrugineus]|uniref:Esterase n=1 Tax=Cystobacter ferrugineus TaxID=83449 RepID=A0A1L9B808_9BACT|nr:PHB depolymerase family esterase [Cystobacter ferrugineus]OJH38389.1 esterase [Cystobacter ferrugineus]